MNALFIQKRSILFPNPHRIHFPTKLPKSGHRREQTHGAKEGEEGGEIRIRGEGKCGIRIRGEGEVNGE